VSGHKVVSLAGLLEEALRRVREEEERPKLGPERVALVTVRDPDGRTSFDLFVDGHRVPASVFEVDAGRGWVWEDWKLTRDSALDAAAEMGPAVFHAVRDAFDDPPGGEFVDRDGRDWLD
jgi:hypothetical protein